MRLHIDPTSSPRVITNRPKFKNKSLLNAPWGEPRAQAVFDTGDSVRNVLLSVFCQ